MALTMNATGFQRRSKWESLSYTLMPKEGGASAIELQIKDRA